MWWVFPAGLALGHSQFQGSGSSGDDLVRTASPRTVSFIFINNFPGTMFPLIALSQSLLDSHQARDSGVCWIVRRTLGFEEQNLTSLELNILGPEPSVFHNYQITIILRLALQNNTQDKCVEAVSDVLYKMNEVKLEVDVFKHVTTDAQIMNITAQSLRSLAEISDTNEETFNVLDLAARWSAEFGNNWDRMSDRALQCFPGRPPVLTYMLGTFEPGEPPAKKRRETKSRNALMNKQKKKPEDLIEADEDDDEMLQQMRFVMSVLAEAMKTNDSKPLCYFRFVVDPHSFSNTIENIFHTSFMVRDGLASLTLRVVNLFQEVVKNYNIKEAMIPNTLRN
uniref:Non-structural maintenance of chromosomes element 4 n=1 Tax=Timema californicum TaxID=61474 RepID=A0A7R9PAE4_TIMCA|nr:unnamed protein product [Timema californicum]